MRQRSACLRFPIGGTARAAFPMDTRHHVPGAFIAGPRSTPVVSPTYHQSTAAAHGVHWLGWHECGQALSCIRPAQLMTEDQPRVHGSARMKAAWDCAAAGKARRARCVAQAPAQKGAGPGAMHTRRPCRIRCGFSDDLGKSNDFCIQSVLSRFAIDFFQTRPRSTRAARGSINGDGARPS